MAERSAAALLWVVVTLVLWVLTRLIPPTGTRRRTRVPMRSVVTNEKTGVAVHRSPYSTDRAPLDGSASRLSRPYLPALAEAIAVVAR